MYLCLNKVPLGAFEADHLNGQTFTSFPFPLENASQKENTHSKLFRFSALRWGDAREPIHGSESSQTSARGHTRFLFFSTSSG